MNERDYSWTDQDPDEIQSALEFADDITSYQLCTCCHECIDTQSITEDCLCEKCGDCNKCESVCECVKCENCGQKTEDCGQCNDCEDCGQKKDSCSCEGEISQGSAEETPF